MIHFIGIMDVNILVCYFCFIIYGKESAFNFLHFLKTEIKQVGLLTSLAVGKSAKFQLTIYSKIYTRNSFIDLEVKDEVLFHLPYFW